MGCGLRRSVGEAVEVMAWGIKCQGWQVMSIVCGRDSERSERASERERERARTERGKGGVGYNLSVQHQ